MSITRRNAHDQKARQVFRGLERRQRPETAQSIRHRERSPPAPERHESSETPSPKKTAGTSPLAATITAWLSTQTHNPSSACALSSLLAQSGDTATKDLSTAQIGQAAASWKGKSQHTRRNYSNAMRRFLAWAAAEQLTARALLGAMPQVHQPDPRTIVATAEEREKLLAAAPRNLRFFILLCADLGLRHKTAAGIRRADYNPNTRSLTFRTKGDVTQTLPVSEDVAAEIEALPASSDALKPIVALLPASKRGSLWGKKPRFTRQWKLLKEKAGVRAELHIHDLRRTAAEEVWDATHNLRLVQAQLGHQSITTTARYLANRVTEVDLRNVRDAIATMRSQPKQRKDTKNGK